MDHTGCEDYLAWRRERVARQHAKLTRAIRDSGIALFLAILVLGIGAYRIYTGVDQLSKVKLYIGLAVGLFATISLLAHLDARGRRQDVNEELEVLDSLPIFQPEPLYRLPPEREPFPSWEQPSA